MKLYKVISGGQTGADRTALECAKVLKLETGGTAPKGWRIDGGSDPSLKEFGLIEHYSSDYPSRTHKNVRDADITVWFGLTNTAGFSCTKNGTIKHNKPFYVNPTDLQLEYIVEHFGVMNVAGNRKRKNPHVVADVQRAFAVIAVKLYRESPNDWNK